ncbi:hypothetical protein ACQEVS_12055 [Streptomyces sp. CA-181903]|uniref:hypothetical protein n=1 Tax=Streptomyces sp. CA-181903 TaxID=3240055 RepID=UPI003D94E7CF
MSAFIREGRLFRVAGFTATHRQLILVSEATAIDKTTTHIEVYAGHVELMFLKPIYHDGLHLRRASDVEFETLRERHDLKAEDAEWTWMLEPGNGSFIVSGRPAWREVEYSLMDRESLFDFSRPWPPDHPAQWGDVG